MIGCALHDRGPRECAGELGLYPIAGEDNAVVLCEAHVASSWGLEVEPRWVEGEVEP